MSKADEMFEKLRYKKSDYKDDCHHGYLYQYTDCIGGNFNILILNTKIVSCYYDNYTKNDSIALSFKELQAINEKVKELGWNE